MSLSEPEKRYIAKLFKEFGSPAVAEALRRRARWNSVEYRLGVRLAQIQEHLATPVCPETARDVERMIEEVRHFHRG